ncbi:response regulator [Beggiatoa leptomitoformis]|uniref:Response regulator n=1 Tax=Beggiatoa leptomitoformis TaxID=288004 RepID=A0A2N9YAN3_9GAMM|nr:response regulator transcription factor [Beggiatoa leptomitoformis]ALG67082.1 response regulator [Beggiatoa leptomitoformis]AUI67526.1 response regulator [Beggiatoa leptomitoformis]
MSPVNYPIRILLVDDHIVVRAGYRRLIERQSHLQIVAEASNGEIGYQLYIQHQPDVIVMDLSMPGRGGITTIQRLSSRTNKARVLVFSMHEEPIFAEHALLAGASGYITKSSAPEVLVEAIERVAQGEMYLGNDIAQKLALHSVLNNASAGIKNLSTREFEVFRLLAEGLSTTDIAAQLAVSHKTIANYYSQIRQKLNVNNTAELIRLAIRHGIVKI